MIHFKKIIVYVSLAIISVQGWAQSIDTDPIVKTMQEELQYNMEQLKSKPVPAYFLSLRMLYNEELVINSSFGVSGIRHGRSRMVVPMVRVGDPKLDNYKYENQGIRNTNDRGAHGVMVPVECNSLAAYRQGIWSETMDRYNIAKDRYEEARSKSQTQTDNEDKAPCFSDAPVEKYYEQPITALNIDEKKWETVLNKVTAVFKQCRDLEDGSAYISSENERVYIVNTDGTAVVKNRRCLQLMLQASINATDGMNCPLYESFFGFTEDELPGEEVLMEKAHGLVARLLALKDAPVADPYAGPAILSSEASGVFFHEIFGHRLESHRMKTGGQTFKKMIGERILPATFQVYCDPTLRYYGKQPLNGHYLYDEEGVKAQRVDNVVDGVLRNFLVGRIPIDGFPQSNGHGRASGGNDPVSRQSNLVVETTQPYTEAQLRAMLIKEAKAQGKDYGYYFRSVTGGYTLTEGLNSFNVLPLEVYRVYVDGRKDELVRGVSLIGTPLAMFSNIAAAGDTPNTFIGQCGAESGWVPVTATSPMIYVSKIETQRSDDNKSIPHLLPLPEYTNEKNSDVDEVIFKAMEDELVRSKNELKIDSLPYYVDYQMLHGKVYSTQATLGGIVSSYYKPNRSAVKVNVLLGDKNVTSMQDKMYDGWGAGVMEGFDYDDLRRVLWHCSEGMYKNAVNTYGTKINDLKRNVLPEEDQAVAERIENTPKTFIAESAAVHELDSAVLNNVVRELSAIFNDYPRIYNTTVAFNAQMADVYRYTSEGLKLRLPVPFAYVDAGATIRVDDGSTMDDHIVFAAKWLSELPDLEAMKRDVRNFAELLIRKADAPAFKEYYVGPIMIEDEAVNEAITRSLINQYGIANRDFYRGSSTASVMLGKRVLDTKMSIAQLSGIDEYKGIALAMRNDVDMDGVEQAKSLPVVEKGILKNLLCGSNPAVGAETSTGNQLMMLNSHYSTVIPGIYHATYEKTVPYAKMKSLLISEAKKAGLDHAYIVKAPQNGWRYLVRVDVKTGAEQILREHDIPQPSRNDMMHITAASKEEFVANKIEWGFPSIISAITPKAMIIENIEYNFKKPQRTEEFQLKNPALRK